MRLTKYIVSLVGVVLALGSLPSIYLIVAGLAGGAVIDGEQAYFIGKLVGHIVAACLLSYGSYRLWRSASGRKRD
jgi:hypothetical protein